MIRKIVSGGQTGVDRAALEVAIHLGIPHGGWVPRGRRAEDGPLPARYRLRETASEDYAERTFRNVRDADGTLILSRGPLTGGSELTRQIARGMGRPVLHVDLAQTSAFQAAQRILEWLARHAIRVLNVAGPRASKDPEIYDRAFRLLEAVLVLDAASPPPAVKKSPRRRAEPSPPQSVREAVARLEEDLPLKDRVRIANMAESELESLKRTLGERIILRFGLDGENETLLRSCRFTARRPLRDAEDAAGILLRALWRELRRTHPLRRIR
ncbi:MAG: putative molybdenum carrier protein [Desulfobacterales bacterium]